MLSNTSRKIVVIIISKRKHRTHEQYVQELFELNPNIEIIDTFVNMVTKILHKCKICGYEWNVRPHDLLRIGRTHCPECSKWQLAKNREKQNYQIGQTLVDNNRDITIINVRHLPRKNNNKIWEYQYLCNKCGFNCRAHFKDGIEIDEYWITQDGLNHGKGCACCLNRVIVPTINSINAYYDKYGWMINYFKNKDDAQKYSSNYSKKILLTCPDCGRDKYIAPHTLQEGGFGCICGDGISYPEKFLYSILEQLNINFEYHKTFEWSKKTINGLKSYDFYVPDRNLIIETHGLQHYQKSFGDTLPMARTFEQEKKNDLFKKELALKNGINNYIELNCSISDYNFIYNSIIQSNLLDILHKKEEEPSINIVKADIFASSNLIKMCSNLWNEGLNTLEIANKVKINRSTVRRYLHKANKFGWCKYGKI